MTQKQRIEELEAKVAALEARLAGVEARPIYPYAPYIPPFPVYPWQTTWGNGTSPSAYGTFTVNDGGI